MSYDYLFKYIIIGDTGMDLFHYSLRSWQVLLVATTN